MSREPIGKVASKGNAKAAATAPSRRQDGASGDSSRAM